MPTKAPIFRPYGNSCQHKQAQQRQADRRRPSAARRGYGRRWQEARDAYLRAHPLCAECKRQGKVVTATCVDHIVPVSGPDDPKFWARSNWQSLCTPDHSAKTAKEDGGFGNVQK